MAAGTAGAPSSCSLHRRRSERGGGGNRRKARRTRAPSLKRPCSRTRKRTGRARAPTPTVLYGHGLQTTGDEAFRLPVTLRPRWSPIPPSSALSH